MIILEEQTGLNAGLNKKLKIGSFIKRNIKSAKKDISIKNAIKVGKVVVPIATTAMSFFPATAPIGIAAKIAKAVKLAKIAAKAGKVGRIAMKVKKIAGSKVGKFAIQKLIKPTIKNAMSVNKGQPTYNEQQQMEISEPIEVMPNTTPTPAQLETIAQVKGVTAETLITGTPTDETVPNEAQIETISKVKDIPMQDLKDESVTQKEIAKNEILTTGKPNYTIPIVVGVGVLGAVVLLATSSKSN